MKGKYKRREATQVQALQLSGLTTLDKLLTLWVSASLSIKWRGGGGAN